MIKSLRHGWMLFAVGLALLVILSSFIMKDIRLPSTKIVRIPSAMPKAPQKPQVDFTALS